MFVPPFSGAGERFEEASKQAMPARSLRSFPPRRRSLLLDDGTMAVRPRSVRPIREARSLARLYRIVLVATLVTAAISTASLSATASPLSQTQQQAASTRAQIDALDGKLAKTVQDYDAANARVASLERAASDISARLDQLVARLDTLQERLDMRAADMYRGGPYAFVEVLAGTTSFDQFVSTWDLLTELSRQDAGMIESVREARVAAVISAKTLQAPTPCVRTGHSLTCRRKCPPASLPMGMSRSKRPRPPDRRPTTTRRERPARSRQLAPPAPPAER